MSTHTTLTPTPTHTHRGREGITRRTHEVHVRSTVHSVPVPGGIGRPVGPALVVLAGQYHIPAKHTVTPYLTGVPTNHTSYLMIILWRCMYNNYTYMYMYMYWRALETTFGL